MTKTFSWQSRLAELFNPGQVLLNESDRLEYAGDKWSARALPEAVVIPDSTADVSALMRFASEYQLPVTARGGGAGYVGGSVPVRGGIIVSFERMNRILEISTLDGVAVVQPGVITADIQDQAETAGWFYPPDPASRKECTIGGNIATNAGGPRCLKYGVTRSYILGLEVVLPSGKIVRCGGRTHKNKTGFDLVGLFTGSEGMLGLVTEATLRIIPLPPARNALGAAFASFAAAAAAVNLILQNGHLPSALEITDRFTLDAARVYLGSGVLPDNCNGHLIVELDGREYGVQREVEEISSLLQAHGALQIRKAVTEQEVGEIWQLRREFSYSLKATGMTKLNEDIVVPRSKLVELVEYCETLQRDKSIRIACFGHAGDGNIHTNIMVPDYNDPGQRKEADECVDELFRWIIARGGSITGEHGIGLAKARWFGRSIGDPALELHRSLKRTLDPGGILNPGKMNLDSP